MWWLSSVSCNSMWPSPPMLYCSGSALAFLWIHRIVHHSQMEREEKKRREREREWTYARKYERMRCLSGRFSLWQTCETYREFTLCEILGKINRTTDETETHKTDICNSSKYKHVQANKSSESFNTRVRYGNLFVLYHEFMTHVLMTNIWYRCFGRRGLLVWLCQIAVTSRSIFFVSSLNY